ncbi:MAG: hypothetical protein HMLKMBBP_01183 [Planctomycetes bacterium]|nr:hypothetical protein [Planctomycetota bacterium]
MTHEFEFIGSRLMQSLDGVSWSSAWISFEIVDQGVIRRSQRFRPETGGSERDFRLIDPIGVAKVVESLRDEMAQQGYPRWSGLVIKLHPTGDYQFEYRYPDSGPSHLLRSNEDTPGGGT